MPRNIDPILILKSMLYANTPMQYTAIFHGCKNGNFQMKKMLYTGSSNEYPHSMFLGKI